MPYLVELRHFSSGLVPLNSAACLNPYEQRFFDQLVLLVGKGKITKLCDQLLAYINATTWPALEG